MYSLCCNVFLFVAIVMVQSVRSEMNEKRKDKVNSTFIPLPINSKFLNPQIDDKTNMKLIGIQFLDDLNKTKISDKSTQFSRAGDLGNTEGNWTSSFLIRPDKRGERYLVWGLVNLLKPWTNDLQDAGLPKKPEIHHERP